MAAVLVFMLIMGVGLVWNFRLSAGLEVITVHPTTTGPTTLGVPPYTPATNQTSSTVQINSKSSTIAKSSSSSSTDSAAWKQEWLSYARVAWQFFKPGVGVSPTTGLIYASPYWHRFTDWDLGGYVLAVLSAEQLGIISKGGTWGADYRLQLVLKFLDTRPLGPDNTTFQFYDSDTGTVSPDGPPNAGNIIDEGRLLIALYDTKVLNPELTSEIEAAIHHVNYTYFASDSGFASGDVYSRYAAIGFNLWGFKTPVPPNENAPSSGSFIIAEPVVSAILEGVNDTYLTNAAAEDYFAQYAAFNRTGVLMALTEGQYPPYENSTTPYVYEAIEVPSGTSYYVQTWQGENVNSSPEAFTKLGFAFYAIYKSTYGALLISTMGNLTTSTGYMEGVLTPSNQVFGAVSDNSNIMIMEACAYAVNPI